MDTTRPVLALLCCSLSLPLSLAGCASPRPSPFMGDDQYLKVGVDPDGEARATVERFDARGQHLYRRVRGRHFVALGFADGEGRPTAVRVLTAAGVGLSVDSEAAQPGRPAVLYGLLDAPLPPGAAGADADGDGFEEVFLYRRDGDDPEGECVIPFRVRDAGFVDPVLADFGPLGPDACVVEVRDVDGDGRVELLARQELPPLPGGRVPWLLCPLWPRAHRFEIHGPVEAAAAYYAGQRATRLARLGEADTATDTEEALRLAGELGLVGHMQQGPELALSEFEAALAGLSPSEAQRAWVQEVRDLLSPPASTNGGIPRGPPARTPSDGHEEKEDAH